MSNQVADTRYLFRKGRTWYVRISITPSLRHHYGGKECYVKSTKCHDLRDAQVRRNEIVASFKRELHELKQGRSKDAAAWREEYLRADAHQLHMVDLGDGRVERFTERELVHDLIADNAAEIGRAKGMAEGFEFLRQATAEHTISEIHALWLGEVQQDRSGQTVANYNQALRELVAHVGDHAEPKEITRRLAGGFVSTRLVASGRAKRTQAKLISALAAFWTWMRRGGYVDENPWEKQALPYKKQSQEDAARAYTHDELLALLTTSPKLHLPRSKYARGIHELMRIGLHTGMRLSEMCDLNADDVDLKEKAVRITTGKTAASRRVIPIVNEAVWSIIEQRCREAQDGWLFHEFYAGGYDGKRGHKVSPNFTKFRRAVLGMTKEDDLAAAQAGEPKVNFHSFRHTWATYCEKASTKTVAANASVRDQLFGHKKAALALHTYSEGLGSEELQACMRAVQEQMEDDVLVALKVPFGD